MPYLVKCLPVAFQFALCFMILLLLLGALMSCRVVYLK